jgi:replicative DNA helicase
MKQFKFDDEQIVIDKYLPHNFLAEKMILSCLLINSDAIEVTIRNIPIDAFIFKTIKIYRAIIFMYRNKALSIYLL